MQFSPCNAGAVMLVTLAASARNMKGAREAAIASATAPLADIPRLASITRSFIACHTEAIEVRKRTPPPYDVGTHPFYRVFCNSDLNSIPPERRMRNCERLSSKASSGLLS